MRMPKFTDYFEELKLVLSMIVLVIGLYVAICYLLGVHPRSRSIVRLRGEDIITVDGVSEDGWLTECNTGEHRHIAGDFSVVDHYTKPIVCANERGYDGWLKQGEGDQRRASDRPQ